MLRERIIKRADGSMDRIVADLQWFPVDGLSNFILHKESGEEDWTLCSDRPFQFVSIGEVLKLNQELYDEYKALLAIEEVQK